MKLMEILRSINEGSFSKEEMDIIDKIETAYSKRFPGEEFLYKAKKNPNFVVIPSHKMGKVYGGKPNKCETNTFNYLHNMFQLDHWESTEYPPYAKLGSKDMVEYAKGKYFPVGGYQVTFSGWLVEHWWIYDKSDNQHKETCPFDPKELLGYIGVINYDINDEIAKENYVFDVDFFRGGNPYVKYFK